MERREKQRERERLKTSRRRERGRGRYMDSTDIRGMTVIKADTGVGTDRDAVYEREADVKMERERGGK